MSTVSKRGILFRGATGELWLLFEDDTAPRPVPQDVLAKELSQFAQAHSADFMVSPIPDDIVQALEAFFGISLMNAHFCNAPHLKF